MKSLRSIPRVLKINAIDGYRVSLLFNNGESRIIDFNNLFINVFKKQPGQTGYELIEDENKFEKIKIINNSVGWEEIGKELLDENGQKKFYHYDLDPIVLYQNSELDEARNIIIGLQIKAARVEAGMTQQELAEKSGTTKNYISRLENNKSDIELMTLQKIVEAGLGKQLKVQIE